MLAFSLLVWPGCERTSLMSCCLFYYNKVWFFVYTFGRLFRMNFRIYRVFGCNPLFRLLLLPFGPAKIYAALTIR